jgi:hypothetical protein
MLFRQGALDSLGAHLEQLGVGNCPACGSSALRADRRPVLMYVGGTPTIKDSATNMLFLLRLFCEICGYVMLFDTEKYATSDDLLYEADP